MAFVLTPLSDSFMCRLCCNEFTFGIYLFESDPDTSHVNLQDVINKYLPLKVNNDGKLPCRICPDCHNQLAATVEFFNTIIAGQDKLRQMWQKESVLRKSLCSSNALYLDKSVDEDPITVVKCSDTHFYPANCEISLSVGEQSSPTKKPRGRPRKVKKIDETADFVQDIKNTDVSTADSPGEDNENGTLKKRRRQLPKRISEAIAGSALDKLLDEGTEISGPGNPSVIGHLKSKDGARTEPVVKYDARTKKRTKEAEVISCNLCGQKYENAKQHLCQRLQNSEAVQVKDQVEEKDETLAILSSECQPLVFESKPPEGTSHGLLLHLSEEGKDSKTGANLACTKCNRMFSHGPSLAYHMKVTHDQDDFFQCASCDKTFLHKQLLLRHQTVHSAERPFFCTMCPLKFKTNSNLWNHVEKIHRKGEKFQCDVCKQYFKYKSSLAHHMLTHQGIKPFRCDYCGKAFVTKGNMLEHTRTHTGEKPFECSVCQKRFTTSSQVNLHVKTHSGLRPWQCTFCPRAFIHKEPWKTHERRHKGEKPYVCNYCSRGFAENWALKKHIRLHTGEKPYKCNVCDKTFADCSNLKKHKNVHMEDAKISRDHLLHLLKQGSRQSGLTRIQSKDGKLSEELIEFAQDNYHKSLFDEEGTPLTLSLPHGRSVKLLSIDDDGILHALTSDGWTIQLQMPAGCNIEDENTLGVIREAILAVNPKDEKEVLDENTTLLLDEDALLDPSLNLNAILLATDGDPDTVESGLKNVYLIE